MSILITVVIRIPITHEYTLRAKSDLGLQHIPSALRIYFCTDNFYPEDLCIGKCHVFNIISIIS